MIVRLRTQQIIIDLPKLDAEPWVKLTVQRLEMDDQGKVLNTVDRWGTVNKKLSDVALQIHQYKEILPLAEGHISVFAISDAIESVAVAWVQEKFGGVVNEAGELIL